MHGLVQRELCFGFAKHQFFIRYVFVIGYWVLGFICNLMLEIWDLII
jgi:hypothetical protein